MGAENINRRLNIYINDREVVNSMRGVGSEMARVRNEMRNLNAGADNYNQRLAELRTTYSRLSQEQARFRSEIAETPSILRRMSSALGPVASGMIAAFSIGSLVSGAMASLGNAKRVIFEFEQGVADLSAITGVTGKNLDFLKNKAIELGEKTQGGAVAVIEAYKLIASAKPELLSNVEALNEVTEATLLLAKASGMDVPQAATKLTDAMNQFNAPASEASKYVDVLAAGAKYGAAEIPQLTDAVLEFGAVAKVSNVEIKESVALVELMAEKGQKGAEAGTKIRNILLQVLSGGNTAEARKELDKYGISIDNLKNKSIPFSDKLESLKPLLKDVASVTQVFGKENATAAITLIENTNRLKELTTQVGEFGVAEQQAAIKMDTAKNKAELLDAKYESLIISIGNGRGVVSEFFKFMIDGASSALTDVIRLNSSWDELNAKAKGEGQKSGKGVFQSRFNNLQGTGSDADIAKSIKTVAEKDFKILQNSLKETEKLIKEHEGEKAYLGLIGEAGVLKRAKAEKEILIKSLNENAAIIREANKKINPTTTETGTETGTGTGTDTTAADAAAKKRAKSIADAQKHSEDLLKIENDLQKSLNDSKARADELKFGLIEDDFSRERALINAEFDKKIEDFELNIKKEQEAIDKLKSGIANPKTSSEDLVSYKKQLKDRLAILENYNKSMLSTDQTRDLKLGALQEKFLQKNIQDQEKANARDLLNLRTKQNNELAGIKTLKEAKIILSQTLSADELAKIKTLDDAKKAIKEQHLKEEYNLQLNYLNSLASEYKNLLDGQSVDGLKILTPEQRDEILKNLETVKNKLSEITLAGSGTTPEMGTKADGLKALSSLDILGSSPEQWDAVFGNLTTAESKIAAVTTVVNGLQNAFGMYFQFVEAGEKRTLQKFEANAKRKKDALSDQLERGAITQEVYNARIAKLDADLAKKKAEIEYKQAKRQKAMQAAQIISSTALAIMGIWAQVPKFDFGISAGVLTGVVAGLGAAQLGLLLAQPLPDKNGFYDGGYTGSGNERNSPGPVHYDEYVIPKKVLFGNDPVVPNIVGYLEAKRTGKQPMNANDDVNSSTNVSNSSGNSTIDLQVVKALDRNSAILEKLEDDGVQAYLVNDYQTAKKMRDKIKEVTKNETNAKP